MEKVPIPFCLGKSLWSRRRQKVLLSALSSRLLHFQTVVATYRLLSHQLLNCANLSAKLYKVIVHTSESKIVN